MIDLDDQDVTVILSKLMRMSDLIEQELQRLQEGLPTHEDEEFWEEAHDRWSRYLVSFYWRSNDPVRNFDGLSEVYPIQVHKPASGGDDDDDDGHQQPINMNDSLALHIHVELMRMKIILCYENLKDKTQWVPPVDPLWDDMPSKSPLLFSLREVRETMEHLVAKISSLPLTEHLLEFIEHIELKLGMMYSNALPVHTIMDDEEYCQLYDTEGRAVPNRKLLLWASIYHTEAILIPLYYFRLIPVWDVQDEHCPKVSFQDMHAMRDWFWKLCQCPEDQLREIKVSAIDEAFRFAGDESWYAIEWPNAPNNRSDILTQLHEDTYLAPYRTAVTMSLPVLLDQQAEDNRLLGSLFVLEMVDHWFKMELDIEWKSCYCIEEADLEMAISRLEFCADDPFILRRMYRFVILYQKRVIETRNIFETICLWFEIVTCYARPTSKCGHFFRNRFTIAKAPWEANDHHGDDDDDDSMSLSSSIDGMIIAEDDAFLIT